MIDDLKIYDNLPPVHTRMNYLNKNVFDQIFKDRSNGKYLGGHQMIAINPMMTERLENGSSYYQMQHTS